MKNTLIAALLLSIVGVASAETSQVTPATSAKTDATATKVAPEKAVKHDAASADGTVSKAPRVEPKAGDKHAAPKADEATTDSAHAPRATPKKATPTE